MHSAEPCLSIGYGADSTRAVLAWPDGQWQPLTFDDGTPVLSSAVHTDGMLVGQAAWRHAATAGDGFVPSPLRALSDGDDGPAVEWAAATLRQVAAVAARRVGVPVADVRMVVPAGWGPQRRTRLRQAAHRAGLGQPRLVEAPVAAADRLLAVGVQVPVGAFLLFCDLGAGCEASVLRRGPGGFEVLSTIADTDAGAWCVDERLTVALAADNSSDGSAGPGRWPVVEAVRAAREQLSTQTVVTVVMPPPASPMVVHGQVVEQLAEPVWHQAGEVAARAVAAAELTPDQLAGVYLIGGAAATPAVPRVLGAVLGVEPVAVTEPGFAPVLGTIATDHRAPATTAVAPAEVALPPFRRLSGILVPGAVSLVLYCHMVFSATFHNGTPDLRREGYYVLATWGELSTAAVFALVAALAAGSVFGAVLSQSLHRDGAPSPPTVRAPGAQVAGGVALAAVTGLAVAALYGTATALYFALPPWWVLRWTLWPTLPTAVLAGVLAWLLLRRPISPPRGWDAMLAFPISSVVLTAVGTILLAIWWNGPIPALLNGWAGVVGHVGGALIGVGVACALVRHPVLRVGLGVFLALFGFLSVGVGGTNVLAGVFAVAVAVWLGYRLWLLLRLSETARHAP